MRQRFYLIQIFHGTIRGIANLRMRIIIALAMKKLYTALPVFVLLFTSHLAFPQDTDFSTKLRELIPAEARTNGKLGVAVNSLTTNERILDFNSEKLFIPASNMKVIISVTALSLLGADYRFKTEFCSGGELANGVLYGGLYIKGYGDPTLSTEYLRSIADELKKMGIREIRSGITVDASYFDNVEYGNGWKEEWKGDIYSPPIGALPLNYNTFDLSVYPSKFGSSPRVSLEPAGTNVNLINKAVTSNRGSLVARWLEDGKTVLLQGRISTRTPIYTLKLPVHSPAVYTGSAFKKILEESGIKVEGFITVGEVPRWASIFYTHFSEPLYLIVSAYNKNSVNLIGENIIKTLGAKFKGEPGTWENGAQVVSDFLRKIGIKGDFNIVDGSGLSPLNKISPDIMTQVLKYGYKDKDISLYFLSSLSVAGVDGTLKNRFRASDVTGRIIAKTGYLNNVRTLSGYIYTKTGDVLTFSILANGLGWKAKEFQDDLLSRLMECCESN
ncbi:MAG TPA: D-alanyl-D-alanine carboxypeptidase/D-alanyl-D-alanine-endopeptidase [Thermodesulfobacteriota bacterium]|nr:D-alanyl-D-alanine carboxypeptidase/D-alanyl-D-alanine-endopeptidase [Thermodesulfobacteriota bacterium]